MSNFPTLWDKLLDLASLDRLKIVDRAYQEVIVKEDNLRKWCEKLKSVICYDSSDPAIQLAVRDILASHRRLLDDRTGKSGADPWVIALAKHFQMTVITGEHPTGKVHRPKIPDVCTHYGISCMSIVELIKSEGWIF